MKEGKGGNVAIYREDFSEEIVGVRPGRKTRQRKCWLTLSFNQSRRMSIDLDFFGRTEEVARLRCRQKEGEGTVGGGQGW